jgi:hypothetical protein
MTTAIDNAIAAFISALLGSKPTRETSRELTESSGRAASAAPKKIPPVYLTNNLETAKISP